MAKQPASDFDCPVCGETVPGGARSCPECGACEKSGWSEETYLDGTTIPDASEEFDHEAFMREESGAEPEIKGPSRLWPWVAVVLLAVSLWLLIR
jgi:hypothetical protein